MPRSRRKGPINYWDFTRDLERGAVGEELVVDFLDEEFGLQADNVSTKNSDYDLIIKKLSSSLAKQKNVVPKSLLKKIFKEAFDISKRESVTIEVKYDEAAARYKNLFIELFFNIETGSPGTIFKCKADLIAWVVPEKSRRNKVILLKRPEFLAWLFDYIYTNKNIEFKTPGVSPFARGIAVPISAIKECFACLGEFDYKLEG